MSKVQEAACSAVERAYTSGPFDDGALPGWTVGFSEFRLWWGSLSYPPDWLPMKARQGMSRLNWSPLRGCRLASASKWEIPTTLTPELLGR